MDEAYLMMIHDQLWLVGYDLVGITREQTQRWLSYYPDVIPF